MAKSGVHCVSVCVCICTRVNTISEKVLHIFFFNLALGGVGWGGGELPSDPKEIFENKSSSRGVVENPALLVLTSIFQ